jgi:Fur family ferric uptake transcriptional regulator
LTNLEFLKNFRDAVSSRGLKFTRQREAIAKVMVSGDKHLSLDDILSIVRKDASSVGYATVYRTMKLMVECGLVLENKFANGQATYERADVEHHDHMICTKCGKIVEFEDDEIERKQEDLARALGFKVVGHRHEVYVECLEPPCVAE